MTDPKVFTGPGGYTFTLYHGAVPSAAGVIVAYPGAPLDHGTWIPIADLRAFIENLGGPWAQFSRAFLDHDVAKLVFIEPDAPRHARAEARRQAYEGSTAETFVDAEGRDFPPGTRVLSVEPAAVVEPELCESCAGRMAEARAEGKIGIVLCGRCAVRANPPDAPTDLHAQNIYDTAPCFVCGGPRCTHDGPGQDHPFEDH